MEKQENLISERARKNLKVGILGFGKFGNFIARHLINLGLNVCVSDKLDKTREAQEIGADLVSLENACKNKIIILAMPMEDLEETLISVKDNILEGSVVLDVCSLKMFSCKLMHDILPKNIEIIGTHPLFGPQSAPNSIVGMKIALVNVRAKRKNFQMVKDFCEALGLKVIITTAEEHDKQMAASQALVHFIGQVCKKINIKNVELSTKTFDDLIKIINIIGNDTLALFNNMQTMNPFAKEFRENFVREAEKINIQLNTESKRKT